MDQTREQGGAPAGGRVIALGASNLTLGLPALVSAARARYGAGVEVFAALGRGRSYGGDSSLLFRRLPGILASGIWQSPAFEPGAPIRALITDAGNDIMYGHPAALALSWIEACVAQLQQHTQDIVLTGLPMESVRRLSPGRFALFRSILFPGCGMSYAQALEAAEELSEGLAALAAARGLRMAPLRPEWYGFDPIHIRRSCRRKAWREILCGAEDCAQRDGVGTRMADALRLSVLFPERQWLFGAEQFRPQQGCALPHGGRVWLY